jgi:hypothetical protein
MNMPSPATPGEAPIPRLPTPATGDARVTPETRGPERLQVQAALRRLLWLAIYVAVMQAFGYRFRRQRAPRRAPACPAQPLTRQTQTSEPAAPPKPHRKHRYFDRDAVIGEIASINSQVAAAQPLQPSPAPAPLPPAPPPPAQPQAQVPVAGPRIAARASPNRARPHRAAVRSAAGAHPPPCPLQRSPHPPPFKNAQFHPTHTHDHFVAIS